MSRTPFLFIALALLASGAMAELPPGQPLTSRSIHGKGDGQEQSFTVTAGPGEVTVRAAAALRPDLADAVLEVELFDEAEVSLAAATLSAEAPRDRVEDALRNAVIDLFEGKAEKKPAARVTKREAFTVDLPVEETIVVRVRAGEGVSHYRVLFEGAVAVAEATEPVAETPAETPAGDSESVPATEVESTDIAVEAPPAEVKGPIKIPGKKPGTVKVPGKKAPAVQQKPPAPVIVKKIPTLIKKLQIH